MKMVDQSVFHQSVACLKITLEERECVDDTPLEYAAYLEHEAKLLREAVDVVGKDSWIVS